MLAVGFVSQFRVRAVSASRNDNLEIRPPAYERRCRLFASYLSRYSVFRFCPNVCRTCPSFPAPLFLSIQKRQTGWGWVDEGLRKAVADGIYQAPAPRRSLPAADMSVKAPVYRLAMATPRNWTGFYLGGHIGAALASTDIADPLGVAIYGDNVRSPRFHRRGRSASTTNWVRLFLVLRPMRVGLISDGTNTCFAVSGTTASSNCRVRPDLYAP